MIACALIRPMSSQAAEAEDKTVRVGWFISDLFQEGGSDGTPRSGYSYDYLIKISNYSQWRYDYVYGDWSDLYERL